LRPRSQSAEQSGQVQFRSSGLKPVLERGFATALRLWLACAFAEEVGIATEVLDRCKGDRFDAILDLGKAHGRKFGCPMSQRSDEIVERCYLTVMVICFDTTGGLNE
jgi:hypothetical protein